MPHELCLVYVTTKDSNEAKTISEHLLEKNLIACGNILPYMSSQYFWEGKNEESRECVLLLKTSTQNFTKIETEIEKIHSYDTPCIFSIPIDNCGTKYKEWLLTQLGETND